MLSVRGASIGVYNASLTQAGILAAIGDIETLCIVFMVLIAVSMGLRVYVRLAMVKAWGKEDWAMVVTYIFSLMQSIMGIMSCETGKALWAGKANAAVMNNRFARSGYGFHALTLVALKFSLAFFFLRIFSHKKPYRIAIYAVLTLHTLAGLVYVCFPTFTCAQLKALDGFAGTCKIQPVSTALFSIFSVINILSDIMFTGMGASALVRAQMPMTSKVPACALLMLGSMGGVATTIRLAYVLMPSDVTAYTQELFTLGRWVVIELAAGIIAVNFAMIRPLLHAMLVTFGLSSTRSRAEYTSERGTAVSKPGQSKRSRLDMDGDTLPLHEIKKQVEIVVNEERSEGLS